jgi:hypothetical protein
VLPEEPWRILVELHNRIKALLLFAEECEIEHRTFMAPVIQQRDALDHIMRAQAAELGMREGGDDYIATNLDKALGHCYRAFFDIADWLSTRLRERILDALKPHSTACIREVLPEYYARWRPRIDEICREIPLFGMRSASARGPWGNTGREKGPGLERRRSWPFSSASSERFWASP